MSHIELYATFSLQVLHHTLDIHLKSRAEDWNLLIGLEPTPINFLITPIERLLDITTPEGFVEMVSFPTEIAGF